MQADLKFPKEKIHSSLGPDIVLWSKVTKQVVLIELTEPWEERMEEECKNGSRSFAGQYLWRTLGLLGIDSQTAASSKHHQTDRASILVDMNKTEPTRLRAKNILSLEVKSGGGTRMLALSLSPFEISWA